MRITLQLFLFTFLSAAAAHAKSVNGILVIAHGTSHHSGGGHPHFTRASCVPATPSKWERSVLDAAAKARIGVAAPVEVAFGMWETKCYDEAIERLKSRLAGQSDTLGHLFIVPLFISDFSSVIEAQKYIFHLRADSPLPEMGIQPSTYRGPLTYGQAIGYDPFVSRILVDRTKDLARLARIRGFASDKTELVLVMHGPVEDDANLKWLEMGRSYARDIAAGVRLAGTGVISLRDDAAPEMRDRATAELLSAVDGARARGHVALVVPLLLSRGGIEAGIARRMQGHDAVWTGQTLFPDERMEAWLRQRFETIK